MKEEMFTCVNCGQTFPKAWSDEEAMEESRAIWGDLPREELVQICDDCFNRLMRVANG